MKRVVFKAIKKVRPMPAGFYGHPHTHGCAQCGAQIHRCMCAAPEHDPTCVTCTIGRVRPWWPHDELPRDCCRYHATPVQTAERNTFLLAGTRTWRRCQVCRRFHATNPADPGQDPPVEPDGPTQQDQP